MPTAAAGAEEFVQYDDGMPSVDDLEVAAAAAEAVPLHQSVIGQKFGLFRPGLAWRSAGMTAASTSSDEVGAYMVQAILRHLRFESSTRCYMLRFLEELSGCIACITRWCGNAGQ